MVKIIGLRHHYFTLPWNLFDLILVSASIVGLIMEDVLNEFPISPTLLRVVRVFRLGRVLRLVKVGPFGVVTPTWGRDPPTGNPQLSSPSFLRHPDLIMGW